jgi:hypothetical protein
LSHPCFISLYRSPLLIWITQVEPAEGWPPAPQLGNINLQKVLRKKDTKTSYTIKIDHI